MEESPHKCPVCSRSFNQRSNLKTHLLTHTDHKPYECSSCGKVFRRNCDLRRHALTHAVGDVPSEVLDVGEEDRHMSGDEEDTVLEVDSPRQSPMQRVGSPIPAEGKNFRDDEDDLNEDDDDDDIDGEDFIEQPLELSRNSVEVSEVTHCHHEGAGDSYTMRPLHDYRPLKERDSNQGIQNMQQPLMRSQPISTLPPPNHTPPSKPPEPYIPMLHVRRDLHHKNPPSNSDPQEQTLGTGALISTHPGPSSQVTITSGLLDPVPNFLGSIPIRKRAMGLDGEPHPILHHRNLSGGHHHHQNHHSSHHSNHPHHQPHHINIGLTRHHNLLKPPDEVLLSPISPSITSPPIVLEPLALHQGAAAAPPPAVVQPPEAVVVTAPTIPRTRQIMSPPSQLHPTSSHPMSVSQTVQQQTHPQPLQPPQQQPAQPPVRRTGFSIEDIMRR